MKNQNLLKYNLQFFAEPGSDDSGASENLDNTSENGDQSQSDVDNKGESGDKTFTQAELSAIAANEKKQGKQSILNIFGVKDEKSAKEQAEAFKKWQESQKSAEQKLKDQEVTIAEANSKATAAENKLTCLMAGVNKDSLDDIMAIAVPKISDDKDLNAVLDEMKKEPRYKGFFTTIAGSSGTGNAAGHQGTGSSNNGTDNIGERLGKNKAQEAKKSNFFTN